MEDSFEQFLVDGLPSLLRFAGALVGDAGTAEDVVQEVLLKAAPRWPSIVATGAQRAYLRRMVINEHVSWRRKWGRLVPRAVIHDDRVEPDHSIRQADRDELERLLDRLPPRQRTVLVLRYFEGLGDAAIAELLACSLGTVRSHASRALNVLRIAADDTDDDAAPDALPKESRRADPR